MARLRLVDDDMGGEVADRIRARRRGELSPLDRLLLHSPPVADGWNALLGAIRSHTTLPAAVRELVICRVAAVNGAAYAWAGHAPLAAKAGVDDEQLEALRTGTGGHFTDLDQAALDYASSMTRQVTVPDAVFHRLQQHFDGQQIVELTSTIAAYNMVTRFLVALRLEPDGETPSGRRGQ
jgi:4-carboxymuconolactone decarboxylase